MSGEANGARGEIALVLADGPVVLRPSFGALVAAETEIGSLLALVDRAADGRIALAEMAALFWHCRADPADGDRSGFNDAVAALGLARAMPVLRAILHQILAGSA